MGRGDKGGVMGLCVKEGVVVRVKRLFGGGGVCTQFRYIVFGLG